MYTPISLKEILEASHDIYTGTYLLDSTLYFGAFREVNDTKLYLKIALSERHTKLLFAKEAVEMNLGLPSKVPADGWSGTLIRDHGISPCHPLVLYRPSILIHLSSGSSI